MLLSIKELGEEPPESELWQQVYERLDEERLKKVTALQNQRKKAESAGGGLLVQHLLHCVTDGECDSGQKVIAADETCAAFSLVECTLSGLLAELGAPVPVRYTYGIKGKPYLQNKRNSPEVFFNLSHSGDYVVCAVSEKEVGVDIQKMRAEGIEKLADRFFSVEERRILQGRQDLFYRLWTRKEAYGKLTGEGITAAIDKDFSDLKADWMGNLIWEEFDTPSGYKIACCSKRQENGI